MADQHLDRYVREGEPQSVDLDATSGVKVYFNPFAFTVEQNNEFIRLGCEVMPLQVPKDDS